MNAPKDTLRFRLLRIYRSSYSRSIAIRISNSVLAVIVAVLLARLLGPEEYGRYGIVLSFATILAIPFTAGLPKTLTKEIAAARVQHDNGRIKSLITLGTKTFLLIVPIVILIGCALTFSGYELAGISTGVLISAVLAPIASADSNRLAIMHGLGSALRSQIPDLLVRPISTMLIVIILIYTVGSVNAIGGIIAYSVATLIGFILGSLMVRSELKKLSIQQPVIDIKKSEFFTSVGTMSLLGSATTLTGNLDMLLLNQFSTLENAGIYKVSLTGLALVVLGSNAISAVSFTRLAEAIPEGNKKRIEQLSDQALRWSLLLTIAVTVVLFIVGRPVIILIFGSNYLDSWNVLLLLSFGFCVAFSFGQAPEIAALSGAQIPAAISTLCSIGVTIIIAFYSIDSMGVQGVALASMLGTILRFLLMSIIIRIKLGVNITILGLVIRAVKSRSAKHNSTDY